VSGGDGFILADALLAPIDDGQSAPIDDGSALLGYLALGGPAAPPALVPYDTWGLTQIPTSSGYVFTPRFTSGWVAPAAVPINDICLAVILDYLATFLVTDRNAQVAWKAIAPATAAVVRIFPHNPGEVAFAASYCPALFLWREDAAQTWEADDWERETTQVKGLWVYPEALADNQRVHSTFSHTLAKLIGLAIERGRTPGWVQPGDPDRLAYGAFGSGSLFYTYAGFERFQLNKWRNTTLTIPGADEDRGAATFPAVELTFEMQEKVEWGLGRYAVLTGGFDTISNPQGRVVLSGPLNDMSALTSAAAAPAPGVTVSSVSPNVAVVGTAQPVTITGAGFQPGAQVFFGAAIATQIVVVSSTQITCTAPASTVTTSVDVVVNNPNGSTGALGGGFTYQAKIVTTARVFGGQTYTCLPSDDLIVIDESNGLQARILAEASPVVTSKHTLWWAKWTTNAPPPLWDGNGNLVSPYTQGGVATSGALVSVTALTQENATQAWEWDGSEWGLAS
jgi:hypothetical protein